MASSTKAIDANTGVKKKSIFSGWTSVKKKKQADLSVKEDSSSHHFTSDVRDQPSDDSLHAAPTSPSDHTASAAAHGNHHEAKTGGSGVPQLDGKLPQEVHSSPFPSVHDGPTPASISDVYSRWGRWSTMCRTLMCPPPSRNGQPIGLLELDIFEGFRLPASDMGISSDPYLVATLTGCVFVFLLLLVVLEMGVGVDMAWRERIGVSVGTEELEEGGRCLSVLEGKDGTRLYHLRCDQIRFSSHFPYYCIR